MLQNWTLIHRYLHIIDAYLQISLARGTAAMGAECFVEDLMLVASEILAKSATSATSASEEVVRPIIPTSKDPNESHRILKNS